MNIETEIKWTQDKIDVLQKEREEFLDKINAAIDNLIQLKATLYGKQIQQDIKIKIGVQD